MSGRLASAGNSGTSLSFRTSKNEGQPVPESNLSDELCMKGRNIYVYFNTSIFNISVHRRRLLFQSTLFHVNNDMFKCLLLFYCIVVSCELNVGYVEGFIFASLSSFIYV